ncbi:MAG: hypothetical protein HY905_10535 [Deltaproteobacteria bacterium]|nr:hypothetical protein [Deltaproteobacteria bacterium]
MRRAAGTFPAACAALLVAAAACGLQSGGLWGDGGDAIGESGEGDAARPDDGGPDASPDGDAVSDAPGVCGNGTREGSEECDDGNSDQGDDCPSACRAAFCGDGFLHAGVEQCDDGGGNSDTAPDACRTNCLPSRCGDGVVDTSEACDDGNTIDGDDCRNDCRRPGCGNGVVESGEECDDGDTDNTDACLAGCVAASCGDGFLWAGVEECEGVFGPCSTACATIGRRDCVDCGWAAGCTPPAEECNGTDDDCDGTTDEGCVPPPPNDVCTSAAAISPGTIHGDTTRATDTARPSCAGAGGRDLWYAFTLSEGGIVYLDTADGGAWSTVLEVRSGSCPGTAVSGGCNDDACGGVRSQLVLSLEAGTYTVLVDGHDASHGGPFDLFFQTASCPAPRIATNGDTNGNTTGHGDAVSGACGGGSADEDAYFFALCRPASVTAHTCSSVTTFDTVLYLRTGDCWDGSPEVACNDDSTCAAAAQSSRVTATLPHGLSFVVVDGYGSAAGPYRLNVSGLP